MSNLTGNAIKASFLKLLNERALNKITIKDIVGDCGLNRNTFYYHYQDIPALLEEVIMEETDKLIEQYPRISSFEECVRIAVDIAMRNKRAVYHIYNSVNRDLFERHFWRTCEYVVTTYIDTVFAEYHPVEEDRQVIIGFYKCWLFGQISEWLDGGMKDDIIEISQRLCDLRKGMPEEMLRRSRKKS